MRGSTPLIRTLLAGFIALLSLPTSIPASAATILTVSGNGAASVDSTLAGAGHTVVSASFNPGVIESALAANPDISQIWIWNDGSYGNTGVPTNPTRDFNAADDGALQSFGLTHTGWVMDALAWRSHGGGDSQSLTTNIAFALEGFGGGIVLGTDDASGDALVQHVNHVADLFNFNSFEGVYQTPPGTHQSGGAFFTTPNPVNLSSVIGTTTYAQVPNGLQPNGIVLGTAVFGQGNPFSGFGSPPLGSATFGGVSYENANHLVTTNIPGAAIPEPSTALLLGMGMALLSSQRRPQRRN